MKVNVLGTDYKINLNCSDEEFPILKNADGYVDFSTKNIYITALIKSDETMQDLKHYEDKVLRHEIVHAFMYESGLDVNSEWGTDETLIDWIALQLPKMIDVLKHLETNQ